MCDERRGQVSERGAGDNTDDRLLDKIEQGRHQREFAGPPGRCQHAESNDCPYGVIETLTR
jgi:hypothetical protein